jgi:membrane-bound lytic murein transglycosylase A
MKRVLFGLLGVAALGLVGCATPPAKVIPAFDGVVDTPLPDGEYGLFKLDAANYPDMTVALGDRANLDLALTRSIEYMEAPSSHDHYPPGSPISHAQVYAGLLRTRELLRQNAPAAAIQAEIVSKFEVWSSRGYDWNSRPENQPGKVWFTAYYTPTYWGSRVQTSEYKYPLYRTPDDLVKGKDGKILGQLMADKVTVKPGYPSRAELMANGAAALRGFELMWFKQPLDPYIIQVQGSAEIITPNNERVMLGYAASNDGEYLGLGTQLRAKGILSDREVSLTNVKNYFAEHPDLLDTYVNNSHRFVFMKEYTTAVEKAQWPAGSLGRKVTDMRSLATDKRIFPRASMTFVDVPMPTGPAQRIMCDQDTGGAIRAAGRADVYVGQGEMAGLLAGREYSEGHLYYVVMKESEAPAVIERLGKKPAAAGPAPKSGTLRMTAAKTGTTPKTSGAKLPPISGSSEMFPK